LTPDEALELGAVAAAHAAECLLERGVDPDSCPLLLAALERGVAEVVAARELGRDVGEYRVYVAKLYERLDAAEPVDKLPEPPRRMLALRW
jgi:hypothetical protein